MTGIKAVLIVAIGVLLTGSAHAKEHAWPTPKHIKNLPATCRRQDSAKSDIILPYLIRKISLENVSFYAKAGGQPDTFVRFSPDGQLLAIGTFLGRMKVIDVYTGNVLWDKKIAEGMVKKIDFSPDGKRVYFGEQSVDGFVYGAESRTGKILWRFRLADDLKTSAPPGKENIYEIYRLPGCYQLKTLDNGDILVLGIHAWGDIRKLSLMTRLSRIYRFSPNGKVRWAFPKDGPAPLSLIYMDSDPAGRRVAFLPNQTGSNTPDDLPYKLGSIYVLDGATGALIGGYTFKPLKPYFDKVGFWQSVSVGPNGKLASIGTHDGRTFLFDLDAIRPRKVFMFGAPIIISNIPVSAQATYTHMALDGMAYFQTANSSVPNANTMQNVVAPPGPHPNANTFTAVDSNGKIRWRYRSGHVYQNFWTSADGRWLMTPVKRENKKTGRDAGAMLFDTHRPGGGSGKFVYYYQVSGLTFFQADMARDGSAFALVEVPYKDLRTGKLVGKYQVHVVR